MHVIMGGYHPTFLPEEALRFADTVVIGEAEGIWGKVMEDGLAGRFARLYQCAKPVVLDGIPFDRSIFKKKKYADIYPVQYGRGCRYSCDFCSINAFYGNSLRQRPIPEVIAEIEKIGAFILISHILAGMSKK